jgi:hypothetical protein
MAGAWDVLCAITPPEHLGVWVYPRVLSSLAWCYWGAIRFAIWREHVRSAAINDFAEPS